MQFLSSPAAPAAPVAASASNISKPISSTNTAAGVTNVRPKVVTSDSWRYPELFTSHPRGAPIPLTLSVLKEDPFNWYWVKGGDLASFYYITKLDVNGKRYKNARDLLKSPLVLKKDYFTTETELFNLAVSMYENSMNYVKNPESKEFIK